MISKRYQDWQEGKIDDADPVSSVEVEQFNQLSAIGFGFDIVASELHGGIRERRKWDDNFNLFLEFQREHGHSNVPGKYAADLRLGVWVQLQRMEYKSLMQGKKSKLTQERLDRLQEAGFLWDVGSVRSRHYTGKPRQSSG